MVENDAPRGTGASDVSSEALSYFRNSIILIFILLFSKSLRISTEWLN